MCCIDPGSIYTGIFSSDLAIYIRQFNRILFLKKLSLLLCLRASPGFFSNLFRLVNGVEQLDSGKKNSFCVSVTSATLPVSYQPNFG